MLNEVVGLRSTWVIPGISDRGTTLTITSCNNAFVTNNELVRRPEESVNRNGDQPPAKETYYNTTTYQSYHSKVIAFLLLYA